MTLPVLFDYSGQPLRTVLIDGAVIFVGKDACDLIGIAKYRDAIAQLDADERVSVAVDTPGGVQQMLGVTEPGLFALMMVSRSKRVQPFRRWVTHEVLPAIRRTGQFGSQVPATFAEALELAAGQQRAIEAAEAKIAIDAPKVAIYHQLMDADGYYDMLAASKILGVGRTTLFARLRDEGILQVGSNLPYQRYMHHFKVTTAPYTTPDGSTHISHTTRVRPTGLEFIARRLGVALTVGAS